MKRHVAKKSPRTKEELEDGLQEFWETEMTVEVCNLYIDHVFKVSPVCVAMNGKATRDIPSKLFSERSSGKSFQYFSNLLSTEDMTRKLTSLRVCNMMDNSNVANVNK
ncbi:hypothetical protein DPMN_010104 [Dreissena polymorpha]|uniref:Uncharacterized protein n=1 Tax=Dreissena polymorpha TaxID=45954 RepID=A0A9D4N1G4_DREPO|nr:hypothetical protein DPMN_010104 [Dreissena polymorpha]